MKACGKNWNYNVKSCRYCLYRKDRKIKCVYPSCCCPIPQIPPFKIGGLMTNLKQEAPVIPQSECNVCPYGGASHCLSWDMKKVLGSVCFSKECVSP